MTTVTVSVVQSRFGHVCLVINNRRVAGQKPWGGGQTIYSWEVSVLEVRKALPRFRRNRTVILEEERDTWKSWAWSLADQIRPVLYGDRRTKTTALAVDQAKAMLEGFDNFYSKINSL